MTNERSQTADVAVVGAGPVGLFLTRELTRRGHRVRLIEQRAGQSEHSKALAIMPRTMEVLEMAQTQAPFEAVANRVTSASIFSHQRELGRIPFAPHESRYAYVAMVPQDVTERLLLAALAESGGDVEYQTTLASLERNVDSVTLNVTGPHGPARIEARYVVGCDGAHSTVRHAIGLPFEGEAYAATFALVDAETTGDLPADAMQLCPHEAGPVAIFPMNARRRRFVALIGPEAAHEPTLDETNAILADRGPRGLRAQEITWASLFRIHHRQTPSMRSGRIFLAGDASHIHSPMGAQGMNTGLQDAWNLAWKLDFTLRGWATDELLESYSLERHPIAERVIALTDALTRAMSGANAPAQAARDAVLPLLARFEPFRKLFVSNLSELGITLHGSPIVDGAGRRAPDVPVAIAGGCDGHAYELLAGRYLLLVPAGDNALAASADSVAAATGGALTAGSSAALEKDTLRLVRPDGYVAYERAHTDPRRAAEAVRRVLSTHLTLQPR